MKETMWLAHFVKAMLVQERSIKSVIMDRLYTPPHMEIGWRDYIEHGLRNRDIQIWLLIFVIHLKYIPTD